MAWIHKWAAAFVVLSVVFSVTLGLLFIWDRGLYMDDYFTKESSHDLVTGTWKPALTPLVPHARILGQLVQQNTASAIPTYEFPARLLWACVHLASVVMVGLIIYKLTESHIAGTIALWLYLMPLWAIEAILWFTQVGQHGIAALLFLLALYLMILVIKGSENPARLACLAAICVALGLQFSEMPFPVIGYAPLLTLALVIPAKERHMWRRRMSVAVGLMALGLIIAFVHYKLFTGRYLHDTQARGELQLSLLSVFAHYNDYLHRLYWSTLSSDWGLALPKEALALGLNIVTANALGLALLVLLVVSSLMWVVSVRLPMDDRREAMYIAGVLVFAGVVWMFAALLPGTLLSNQMLEGRMLYIAVAGLALAGAAFVWGCVVILQRYSPVLRRIILAVPACIMVLSTIAMVGYCQVYRLRYLEDTRQIAALQSVVRPESLKPNTTFIPIKPDVHILSGSENNLTTLDRLLFGVFEIQWAGRPALQMAYRREDISLVTTNHWTAGMSFGLAPARGNRSSVLLVDNNEVPLDRALAFTYRDGRIVLLSPLVVTTSDGQVQQTIDLPLVRSYKDRGAVVEPVQVAARKN